MDKRVACAGCGLGLFEDSETFTIDGVDYCDNCALSEYEENGMADEFYEWAPECIECKYDGTDREFRYGFDYGADPLCSACIAAIIQEDQAAAKKVFDRMEATNPGLFAWPEAEAEEEAEAEAEQK